MRSMPWAHLKKRSKVATEPKLTAKVTGSISRSSTKLTRVATNLEGDGSLGTTAMRQPARWAGAPYHAQRKILRSCFNAWFMQQMVFQVQENRKDPNPCLIAVKLPSYHQLNLPQWPKWTIFAEKNIWMPTKTNMCFYWWSLWRPNTRLNPWYSLKSKTLLFVWNFTLLF